MFASIFASIYKLIESLDRQLIPYFILVQTFQWNFPRNIIVKYFIIIEEDPVLSFYE